VSFDVIIFGIFGHFLKKLGKILLELSGHSEKLKDPMIRFYLFKFYLGQMIVPKATAKLELLFNKLASADVGLFNTDVRSQQHNKV
jgi:hypothetical protein